MINENNTNMTTEKLHTKAAEILRYSGFHAKVFFNTNEGNHEIRVDAKDDEIKLMLTMLWDMFRTQRINIVPFMKLA